jgi:nitrilase
MVFPEAWIPGYPTWIWRLKPGADMALSGEIHGRLWRSAVDIERGDLKPLQDAAARRGVVICWESYMPLARYALYAQHIDILVNPTWDNGEVCLATLRHIAREGGCWVIGTATAMQGSDIPADFPDRDRLFKPEEWINDGDATVIRPGGAVAAGPLNRDKGILYAEIDTAAVGRARRSLDVSGHYSRPDIFSLSVNRKPSEPVVFAD